MKQTQKQTQKTAHLKNKKSVQCATEKQKTNTTKEKQKTKTIKEKQKTQNGKRLHKDISDAIGKSSRLIGEEERVRGFSVELYASPEHWGDLLKNADHYAWVYHDRDKYDDGTEKPAHYHILLRYKNGHTTGALRKMTKIDCLDKDTTMLFQRLANKTQAFKYLMHQTEEAQKQKKATYGVDEVHYDDEIYWTEAKGKDDTECFIEDICNRKFSYRNLAIKYGRDFMLNYRKYEDFVNSMLDEEYHNKAKKIHDEICTNLEGAEAYLGDEILEVITDQITTVILDSYNYECKGMRDSNVLRDVLKKITQQVEVKTYKKVTEELRKR